MPPRPSRRALHPAGDRLRCSSSGVAASRRRRLVGVRAATATRARHGRRTSRTPMLERTRRRGTASRRWQGVGRAPRRGPRPPRAAAPAAFCDATARRRKSADVARTRCGAASALRRRARRKARASRASLARSCARRPPRVRRLRRVRARRGSAPRAQVVDERAARAHAAVSSPPSRADVSSALAAPRRRARCRAGRRAADRLVDRRSRAERGAAAPSTVRAGRSRGRRRRPRAPEGFGRCARAAPPLCACAAARRSYPAAA